MRLCAAASFLLIAFSAHAQDAERGRLLYETYCGDCHYERVHQRTRENTQVKKLSDLRDAVARWAPATKYKFSMDEREDVVEYLNRSHYRLTR